MRNRIGLLLACCTLLFLLNCSPKETSVFCMSDEYSIFSEEPALNLSDGEIKGKTEGSALIVLSLTDSLTVKEWDLLSLTLKNLSKGDTLISYSATDGTTANNPAEKYKEEIDLYISGLRIVLQHDITQSQSKKIQIIINVYNNL